MRKICVTATPDVVAPTRIALLPGAYQQPEDFIREGFPDAVRARGLAIDLEFVGPEFQHVLDRAVVDYLHAQVIVPARTAGCRALWLGGVSLGGFIALLYAERRPHDLDGVCLFAPYLGNRMVTAEIARAGGVFNWNPPHDDGDEERQIWRFIRRPAPPALRVHLGIARQDRFGHGQRLFADALAPEAVDYVDGGHNWTAWRLLWALFLDRFATSGAVPGAATSPIG